MTIFYFFGPYLAIILRGIYEALVNYGWAIILFTLIIRVCSFPLQLKQQKSTARMAAYQPMMQEIQKKYANDRNKQNEAMMEFQKDYGFSPTAGCLPMFLNFFVLFGVIDAVYHPIQYILQIGKGAVESASNLVGLTAGYTAESKLLGIIQGMSESEAVAKFGEFLTQADIAAIQNFNAEFLGINLTATPSLAFNNLLIFPLITIVTMIGLNVFTLKNSGQELQGSMKYMPWMMSLVFIPFCFQTPVAFSLYYTVSNFLMIAQSFLLKKIYNPEEYKRQLAEEIAAKKAAKRQKKEVVVTDKNGNEVVKKVNEAEMMRLRIERARQLDEEKYKDERTTPLTKEEEE